LRAMRSLLPASMRLRFAAMLAYRLGFFISYLCVIYQLRSVR
jgi:hypothetical protein